MTDNKHSNKDTQNYTFEYNEQKSTEEDLLENEERLRLALIAAEFGVFDYYPEIDKLIWDKQMKRIWELKPDEEPVFEQMINRIHPEDRDYFRQMIAVSCSSERNDNFQGEFRVVFPDGKISWHSIKGRVYFNKESICEWRLVRLTGIEKDITEQKHNEEILKKSERRKTFLLKLSDALRPIPDLSEIKRISCTLLGKHLEADWVHFGEYCDDGSVLIKPDYFRPGRKSLAGRYSQDEFGETTLQHPTLVLAVADINSSSRLSEQARKAYRALGFGAVISSPLISKGKLIWTLRAASDAPREWTPDEADLVQEAGERTWEAIEQSRSKASLREREAKYRTIIESMDKGYALCELVRDNKGRAIDFHFLEANPAFGKHTGVPAAKATGRLHTEIFSAADANVLDACKKVVGIGRNIRILLVDDHKVMRQGLISLMNGRPDINIVGEASDGIEAIEQVRRLYPNVIVMDIKMPNMDGVEATRKIKAEWPDISVIGLSMFEDEQITRGMIKAGAGAIISKAASSSELLKAIYQSPAVDKNISSVN